MCPGFGGCGTVKKAWSLQTNERHCGRCFNRCPEGQECVEGACQGAVACEGPPFSGCGNPVRCGAGDTCFCFGVADTPGQDRCFGDVRCGASMSCPNGKTECPTGFTCVTNTCCGPGVQLCVPECSVGITSQVTSQGGGQTASGVPH
jgi:hypothetical protein